MKNKRGQTVQKRLTEHCEFARNYKGSNQDKKIFALRTLGGIDLALEFGLITYNEWEEYIKDIFNLI